jgi:hypothetical protein
MSQSDLDLIRTRRAEIARQREALDLEEQDLAVTERTLARLQDSAKWGSGTPASAPSPDHPALKGGQPSGNRAYILAALEAAPDPWVASGSALLGLIKSIYNYDLNQNSLYPVLGDLSSKGLIKRENGRLALAKRVGGAAH